MLTEFENVKLAEKQREKFKILKYNLLFLTNVKRTKVLELPTTTMLKTNSYQQMIPLSKCKTE